MINETSFKMIQDFVSESPKVSAAIVGTGGLLLSFALWKCKNFTFAYRGMEVTQRDPRPTSHIDEVTAKENTTSLVTGSNPVSNIKHAKTEEGSVTSFAIDSATSKDTITAAKGLLEVATRKKKR